MEEEDLELPEKQSDVYLIGRNSLGSRDLFKARKSFEDHALVVNKYYYPVIASNELPKEDHPIKDFWTGDRQLYGKVDHQLNAITPKQDKLKKFYTSSVYAFNFVFKAYEQMTARLNELNKLQRFFTTRDTLFDDFGAVKGYENPLQIYQNNFTNYETSIKPIILLASVSNNIYGFREYADFYVKQLKSIYDGTPFTKSQVIKSNLNSVLNTGLAIEVNTGRYDDDNEKIQRFYRSVNFDSYKKLASNFGFKIDKNIPFRLIADITTPQMISYMITENRELLTANLIEPSVFFNAFYDIETNEFENFKELLVTSYNSFVFNKPQGVEKVGTYCGEEIRRPFQRRYLDPLTISKDTELFLLMYFVDFMIFTSGLKFSLEDVKVFKSTIKNLFLTTSIDNTMGYINKRLNTIDHFYGSQTSIQARKSFVKSGNKDKDVSEVIAKKIRSQFFDIY